MYNQALIVAVCRLHSNENIFIPSGLFLGIIMKQVFPPEMTAYRINLPGKASIVMQANKGLEATSCLYNKKAAAGKGDVGNEVQTNH